MASNLSKRMNTASGGNSSDTFGVPIHYKYFIVQETEETEALLRLTLNGQGLTIKADMPDADGILSNSLVRWHHLRSDLPSSAFREISEKHFNEKMYEEFSELYKERVVAFPDSPAP